MVLSLLVEGFVDEWVALQQVIDMAEPKCPRCLHAISFEDTIQIRRGVMTHVDCLRPRDLSPEERAILFLYCRDHAVAKCVACTVSFRQDELGGDLLRHRIHLCPRCRVDLTESVRGHLYGCETLPTDLRLMVGDTRNAARKLVAQRSRGSDHGDVLMREVEATTAALRKTMKQSVWHDQTRRAQGSMDEGRLRLV